MKLVRCNDCGTLHEGEGDSFKCQKCGYPIGTVISNKEDHMVLTYTTVMQSIKFGYDNSLVTHDVYLESMKMFKKVRDAVGLNFSDESIASYIETDYPNLIQLDKEEIYERFQEFMWLYTD